VAAKREVLIVFTRYPEPGRAKTRLIPALGAEGAADLARRLTAHTLAQAATLVRQRPMDVEVWFDGGDARSLASCYGPALAYRQQTGADLGERMLQAFERTLANDACARALLIGTDCPLLTADLLRFAFDALSRCDLVLGPVRDGGYCLIGLRRAIPELFRGIAWGTPAVRDQTVAIAARLGLAIAELPMLDDIDRPEDLDRLPPHLAVALDRFAGPLPHD
jgi:rSAM/selenodomain-associated transferase 1